MPYSDRPNAPDWRRALFVFGAVVALLTVVASTFYVYISSLTGGVASAPPSPTADTRGDEGVGDSNTGGTQPQAGNPTGGAPEVSSSNPGGSTGSTSSTSGTRMNTDVSSASPPVRTNMDGANGNGGRLPAGVGVAEAKPGPVATTARPAEYSLYADPRFGFELKVPKSWKPASLTGDEASLGAADYDVVFEDPETGARLAASVWSDIAAVPLNLWVLDAGRGMESVDGTWPTNAVISGAPALVLWAPETPTLPARYGAFMVLGRNYWRLAYSARDGGDGLAHFLQLVASFSPAPSGAISAAPDGSSALPVASTSGNEATGQPVSADLDLVPPLPHPEGRYFPSSKLYRR